MEKTLFCCAKSMTSTFDGSSPLLEGYPKLLFLWILV